MCSSCYYVFYLLIMLWNSLFFFQKVMFLCELLIAKKLDYGTYVFTKTLNQYSFVTFFSKDFHLGNGNLKKDKIRYTILETLEGTITLWLCIILFMTVHARAHTRTLEKTVPTNGKKKGAQIQSQITLASKQKAQSFQGFQH